MKGSAAFQSAASSRGGVGRLHGGGACLRRSGRRFGWPEGLAGIGVEPLSKDFTGEMLFAASRGRLGGQVRPEAENLRAEAVSRLRNRRCQSDARRPHELVLSQVPEVKGKV